jgi:hypothetical protein
LLCNFKQDVSLYCWNWRAAGHNALINELASVRFEFETSAVGSMSGP